jgi:C-terminal processing protease CtpA/Prc
MSLQEKVKNIVFYFIKKEYKLYLDKHQVKYIEECDLEDVVDNFYIKKEKVLKEFIRTNLKKMMKDKYPGALVENIIYDIFEDEHLAKNRIVLEIKQFQKSKSNTFLSTNLYEVKIKPDEKHGLGINLSINNEKIIVDGFKKNPDDNSGLPAELSGLINVGDELVEIDNNNLTIMKINRVVEVLKGMNNKNGEVDIKFNSVSNNKFFESNYKVCE